MVGKRKIHILGKKRNTTFKSIVQNFLVKKFTIGIYPLSNVSATSISALA